MSLIIFKNTFPTKKKKVIFIDADSFKYYETMNNIIRKFSMNRQIWILTKRQDHKELIDILIDLNMYATLLIYTDNRFINRAFIESIIPNYNPIGSIYIGNLNSQIHYMLASKIGIKYSSIIHSDIVE